MIRRGGWRNFAAWLSLGFLLSIIPTLLTDYLVLGKFELSTTFFPVLYFALSSFAIMFMGVAESAREVSHHLARGERLRAMLHILIFGGAILLMALGGLLFLSLVARFFVDCL
jgi:hypothetical protein